MPSATSSKPKSPSTLSRERLLTWKEFFEPDDFPACIFRMPFHHFSDITPHRHEFDELAVVTGGSARHEYLGEWMTLQRGDVFYIPKGQAHRIQCPEDANAELTNVLFDFSKLPFSWYDLSDVRGFEDFFWQGRQQTNRETGKPVRLRLSAENLARIIGIIQALEWELAKQNPGYRFMASSLLGRLIGQLSRYVGHVEAEENRWAKRLGGLLCHMEEHLFDPIDVRQMAKIAGMSPSNLRKAFQEAFMESPIHHLHRMRIDRSLQLLGDPEMSFTDIAMSVGFNDSNYYSRIFRRFFGGSPSEYRAQMLEGTIPPSIPKTSKS